MNTTKPALRGTTTGAGRGTGRGTRRTSEYARRKPDGGFCFVPAMAVIAAWCAYKRGMIARLDLQVWLGVFEGVARRCGGRENRFPKGVEHELAELVGCRVEQVRTSIRRLESNGLLRWSDGHVQILGGTRPRDSDDADYFSNMVRLVQNHRRKIPVPRRVIRFLCRCTRPVLIATALGHLLRCMYYRSGLCCPDGRCKSSWIGETFNVDVRNVKAARRELVALGLLIMEPTDQRSMNRWGPCVRFNLEWNCPPFAMCESPPPAPENAPRLPPLKSNRELASRWNNQQPAPAARLVVENAARWRIAPDDLREPRRLQALFERFVVLGVCRGTAAAHLAFFAAAARALRVAKRNPAGFLAALVRRGAWSFATLGDEDQARAWLRQLDAGTGPVPAAPDPHTKPLAAPGDGVRAPVVPESVGTILQRILPETVARRTPSASPPVAPRLGAVSLSFRGGEEGRRGSPRGKLGTMVPPRIELNSSAEIPASLTPAAPADRASMRELPAAGKVVP